MTETAIIERPVSLLVTIKHWLMRLFNREPAPSHPPKPIVNAVDAPPLVEPIERVEAVTPEREKKRRIKRDTTRRETLAELLDGLEGTFAAVKMQTMPDSWLNRDSITALRKLGVHVPHPWRLEWTEDMDIRVDVSKPMPAMMSISAATSGWLPDEKLGVPPEVMFAIRQTKLPWHVSQEPGVPYTFGCAFRVAGKLLWVNMWMTVDPKTGELRLCDELQNKTVVVPMRRPSSRGEHGRTATYTTRGWRHAAFLDSDNATVHARAIGAKNLFRGLFDWWSKRDERWTVVVKKAGDRVTFGIDKELTSTYFADRDKSIKVNGKAKKIIHFVREHQRDTGEKVVTVKEHVRGLREFDWKGFHCIVTAPKLTGRTSSGFDVPGVEQEDDGPMPVGVVSASKVGKMLADMEERDMRKAA